MFWAILAGSLLASVSAWGQETKITLGITTAQAELIVQTLGQIQCQTVSQMAACFKASDLLKDIQNQVRAQQPK